MKLSRTVTEVFQAEDPGRIDRQLASLLGVSRGLAQDFVAEERVCVNGDRVSSKSRSVKPGDELSVELSGVDLEASVEPEAAPLEVLYEDEFMLAVDKPSGIIVHPVGEARQRGAILSGTLVNRLLHHYPELESVAGRRRAGLVHRLDRGTSGVLLVARTSETLEELQKQFKRRQVSKEYLAIADGTLDSDEVRVEVPVGGSSAGPHLREVSPEGKHAVTRFERAGSRDTKVALKCFPLTGRTHQVRVHARHLDLPLVGDKKYGGSSAQRLMLHARKLKLDHPHDSRKIEISSNPPEVFARLWEKVTA